MNEDDSGSGYGARQEYDATCSDCGQPCKVPFKPTEGRPVYCSECFKKHRKPRFGGSGGGGFGGRGGRRRDDY